MSVWVVGTKMVVAVPLAPLEPLQVAMPLQFSISRFTVPEYWETVSVERPLAVRRVGGGKVTFCSTVAVAEPEQPEGVVPTRE
ncbi:hypothetical protein GCM10027592_58370 [Spirosoma flavus]